MQKAPAVAAAAIPSFGPAPFPRSARSAPALSGPPTSVDVRLLVHAVRTVAEIAAVAVRIPCHCVAHANRKTDECGVAGVARGGG